MSKFDENSDAVKWIICSCFGPENFDLFFNKIHSQNPDYEDIIVSYGDVSIPLAKFAEHMESALGYQAESRVKELMQDFEDYYNAIIQIHNNLSDSIQHMNKLRRNY